jgi:hypothetical protein
LLAEATVQTARKLAKVALHISESFQALLDRFGRLDGVSASDRSLFVRGLYDGMMNDGRGIGEPLPDAMPPAQKKSKKNLVVRRRGVAIHP